MVRVCRVVPKDWTRYSPVGNVIPRTRFIVFKTPLNDRLAKRIPKEQRFGINDLFRTLAERGQSLGMVVDLTDTDRYYDKKDFTGMMVKYEKVNCPGRGFVDRDECVESFNQAIQNYIDKCEDQDALIGVHCTHGINRSGYLICRFLIERLGWSSHEALEAFEKARGYPIEKGTYVMAVHQAAKDARNKKVDSDSDSSERRRRKKNKRKHRDEEDNGQVQMGDMISAFLGELGQQAQQLATASSGYSNSPMTNGYGTPEENQNQHWGFSAKKKKYQSVSQPAPQPQATSNESMENSPQVEDEEYAEGAEEDYDDEETQFVTTVEGGVVMSAASKRRARRNRTQKMLAVMKTGRFYEIQAMQAEMVGTHGAAKQ